MLENFVKQIQFDIIRSRSLQLQFKNEKQCDLFPHRVVYLDGILSVVGEDTQSKILKFFPMSEIIEVNEVEYVYQPNLTTIEVSEFINDLRLINGRQERLILKFHAMDKVDVLPEFHYLHNPYITSNAEGDMIWAATLEMCDDIFLWLYKMRDHIEILDPGFVRKEFVLYCEFQKAS
jgi:hypothetical protein